MWSYNFFAVGMLTLMGFRLNFVTNIDIAIGVQGYFLVAGNLFELLFIWFPANLVFAVDFFFEAMQPEV
jgi:hypothetical protein